MTQWKAARSSCATLFAKWSQTRKSSARLFPKNKGEGQESIRVFRSTKDNPVIPPCLTPSSYPSVLPRFPCFHQQCSQLGMLNFPVFPK